MKISQRLTLLFLVIGLLPFVVLGFYSFYYSSGALVDQINGQIKSVGLRQTHKIQTLNERNHEVLGVFLERYQLKTLLRDYAASPSPVILYQLNAIAEEYNAVNFGLKDVSLTDPSGRVITSTDTKLTGTNISEHEEFVAAKAGTNSSVFYQDEDGLEDFLVGPLELESTVVGYAILEAETDNFISIVRDYDELGSTGGTLLVRTGADGKTRYLLPTRFDEKASLKQVDAGTVAATVGTGKDNLVHFEDYRGQEVLGVVHDIPQTDWKMIVKIDKEEVLTPVNKLRNITYIVIAITAAVIMATAFWFSKIIIAPIQHFTTIVKRMKGDPSQQLRVTVEGKDEIGELATSFNNMADKMQFAFASLTESSQEVLNEKSILETLLNNLPVGVLVVKAPTGETTMMNKAGELITGRGTSRSTNKSTYVDDFGVVKEDGSPYPLAQLPMSITLKTGTVVMKDDVLIRRPDGSTVAIRAITAPIRSHDGEIRTAVAVFEDISKERELERSREEFFSIASHELRTPLTAIRGNASLIKQYFWGELKDPSLKEMISDIHESSIRLIEIVNDFLDTSRLEQKRMKFDIESFDIVAIAESVIKEYQVTTSRQKISLEVSRPKSTLPAVKTDKNRLKQVLINLVGNALKFTEGGSVTISFRPEPDFVKVLVSDTGRGISEEAQKKLFRKFEQSGSTVLTRDSVRGTGLGLYISKMMVEQMNGRIKLESSVPNVGTTFSFTVPLASAFVEPVKVEVVEPAAQTVSKLT